MINHFFRSRAEDVYFYKKDRELIEKMKRLNIEEDALRTKLRYFHKCGHCGHDMQAFELDQLTLLHCVHCDSIHIPMEALTLSRKDYWSEQSLLAWVESLKNSA